jgi:hypothetical protein
MQASQLIALAHHGRENEPVEHCAIRPVQMHPLHLRECTELRPVRVFDADTKLGLAVQEDDSGSDLAYLRPVILAAN